MQGLASADDADDLEAIRGAKPAFTGGALPLLSRLVLSPESHGSHDGNSRSDPVRVSKVALTLISAVVLSVDIGVVASEKCSDPAMTGNEIEACLKQSSNSEKKDMRRPTTFPVRFHGSSIDPITSKEVPVDWSSKDGTVLEISTPHICGIAGCAAIGKSIKSIPASRIVSYEMLLSGKGNNASEQVQNVAITAFLLPIAAPFAAAINAKSTEEYRWSVLYIDDNGSEAKETFVTSSNVPVADRYYTFLPTLTGLKYGEKKSLDQLRSFYEDGAKRMESKIQADQALLVEQHAKKPWCAKFKTTEYPLIYSRYNSNISSLNKLRIKLGIAEYQPLDNRGSEDLWQKYLTANPNFAIWVKANPSAAAKIKSCPATA